MFTLIEERVHEVVTAQVRRFRGRLVLARAARLVERARRRSFLADLTEADLTEVASAWVAFVEAVDRAHEHLNSDPEEN
jgi:hypothetical protein